MKKSFENAEDLDGFEEISEANQEKIKEAYERGTVADEGMYHCFPFKLILCGLDVSLMRYV